MYNLELNVRNICVIVYRSYKVARIFDQNVPFVADSTLKVHHIPHFQAKWFTVRDTW